jgi:hypothetical protein
MPGAVMICPKNQSSDTKTLYRQFSFQFGLRQLLQDFF